MAKTTKYDLKKLFKPYPKRKVLFAVGDQVFLHKAHAEDHSTAVKGEVKELNNPKFK